MHLTNVVISSAIFLVGILQIAEFGYPLESNFFNTAGIGSNDDRTANSNLIYDRVKKESILRYFFESEGISLNDDLEANFIDRYDSEIVDKMESKLKSKHEPKALALNAEINSMIFSSTSKRVEKAEKPLELIDEIVLQALDFIVPDSDSEPFYSLAKRDLRDFFKEQPEYGQELVERLTDSLESQLLQTSDAVELLRGFYFYWIPMGRLSSFIEANGSSWEDVQLRRRRQRNGRRRKRHFSQRLRNKWPTSELTNFRCKAAIKRRLD